MNLRPLGYEPSELPICSTPRRKLQVTTRAWGGRIEGACGATVRGGRSDQYAERGPASLQANHILRLALSARPCKTSRSKDVDVRACES